LSIIPTFYAPIGIVTKCVDDSVVLQVPNSDRFDRITWSNGDTTPFYKVTEEEFVEIQLVDTNGCPEAEQIQIINENCSPCFVHVPSSFSPTQDRLNESFGPVITCPLKTYELKIYNRWGEKIYETNNSQEYWDGTYLGEPVQNGVYVWVLFFREANGPRIGSRKGTVTLLR